MKIIKRIHQHCDYQTEAYTVGVSGVLSIDRFDINGVYATIPRLRVVLQDGKTIEMNENGMTIYEEETP